MNFVSIELDKGVGKNERGAGRVLESGRHGEGGLDGQSLPEVWRSK